MRPIGLSSLPRAKRRRTSKLASTDETAPRLAMESSKLSSSVQQTVTASQRVFHDVDLFMLIAEKVTSTGTLMRLIEVCETGWQAVQQMPNVLITVLLNTLPLEIRQNAIAILALRSAKLSNSAERMGFITTYLGHSDEPVPELSNPVLAVLQLRDIVAAIETFTPLYLAACMNELGKLEAVRLATYPPWPPLDDRPFWKLDGDELLNNLPHDWTNPAVSKSVLSYLRHNANSPYPWRFPAHSIETYRIQRAFWRFELFCRLFSEKPTMQTGNDVELKDNGRAYLARLQKWECAELASVVPFLFRVLERIYDPAVFRNENNHIMRSRFQWKSFLAQAPKKSLDRFSEPTSWQNESNWEKALRFPVHGGQEEYFRLGFAGPAGNHLSQPIAELSQQKWLAHQVSAGLGHILACHRQYLHDKGRVVSGRYPIRHYEPSLLYNAPAEAFSRWNYAPKGWVDLDDSALEFWINKHVRQWKDMPQAHLPSHSWEVRSAYITPSHALRLRAVGYVFWDARDKEGS